MYIVEVILLGIISWSFSLPISPLVYLPLQKAVLWNSELKKDEPWYPIAMFSEKQLEIRQLHIQDGGST